MEREWLWGCCGSILVATRVASRVGVVPLGGELLVGVILGGVDRGVLGPRGVLLPDILDMVGVDPNRMSMMHLEVPATKMENEQVSRKNVIGL